MNAPLPLRHKALIEERYAIVVAILLVLAAAGAWGVYTTHVAPEAQTEEHVTASWTAAGEFDHGATVVNASDPFDEGTRVSDRTMYFTQLMPELDGTYVYHYTGGEGSVDAHTELDLLIRSVDNHGEEVFWEVTEPINETNTIALEPGETHETAFTVDVNATNDRIAEIQESLGDSVGNVEVVVRAQTTIEGSVEGESVEDTNEHVLRIEPSRSTYRAENPTTNVETYESVERTSVPAEIGPLRSGGSLLLLIGSLVGLAAVSTAKRNGLLVAEAERPLVEHSRERDEFDDWISRGRFPREILEQSKVRIDSLEGLVDVAIDSERRVIEDTQTGSYYVVDDLVYAYDPPANVMSPFKSEEAGEPDNRSADDDGTDSDA